METQLYDVAEVQLVYKTKVKAQHRPKVSSSKDAYNIIDKLWDHETVELREEFKMLILNRANQVLGAYTVSQGGVAGTIADPKLIFTAALKGLASGIIITHNHPSGNLTPSQSDIELTKKIKEGGRLLEIQLLDHIIYTTEGYYSFADDGML